MSAPTAGSAADVRLRIQLLGGFRVMAGGEALPDAAWRARRAAGLIKLLALAPDHRLHREQAMEALWPASPPAAAARNLHYTLHVARRRLAHPGRDGATIRFQGDLLVLGPPEALWTDVAAFEAAAAAARRGREPAGYQAALALYTGDLLPEDAYAEWAVRRREALRRAYLALLVELAQVEEARARPAAAIAALERVVAAEPADEAAHRGLMRLYAATGRRHAALRQYAALRAALRREVDVEPDATSQRLYRAILAGDERATPAPASPPAPAARPGGNLPAPLTDLVGRERELAELRRLLGQTRLLTVTGAGGVGKTRLALEAALAVAGDYPDGVWLVELAALADPALVAPAVARALAVPDEPGRPPAEVLRDRLAGRRLLLALDNCEHLLEACAPLADALLRGCPGVTILATSREPLRVAGEVSWRAPSLPTPPAGEAPGLAAAARYPAVALFLARARAARPDFAPAEASGPALAQICRRLDGIPLALELAAARATALSVEQIAARLDDRFALLTGGDRAALPRQRTLRATLDWSHDLLTEAEQVLFRRLAVFAGGWTLAAAEAVGGMPHGGGGGDEASAGPPPTEAMLDALARLVDQSLVQADATADGETRYRLLESVRQYAGEKLTAAGEEPWVQERRCDHVLALAERAMPALWTRDQLEWFARLEAEHDNLRAALEWSHARPDGGAAELRLAGALGQFWGWRGYLAEGRARLTAALAHAGEAAPPAPRALALNWAGWIEMVMGDRDRARAQLEASRALALAAGDWRLAALATRHLAQMATAAGDLAGRIALFEEALGLARRAGEPRELAWILGFLADDLWAAGEEAAARPLLEEALALVRASGERSSRAIICNLLAARAIDGGDYAEARARAEEALAAGRELAFLPIVVRTLARLGLIARLRGDWGGARAHYREALTTADRIGDRVMVTRTIREVAGLEAATGRPRRAARLFGATVGRHAGGIAALNFQDRGYAARHERDVAAARAALGEEAFAAAWAEGAALTPEEAVAEALAEEPAAD